MLQPLRGVGSGRAVRPERLTAPCRKTDWPTPLPWRVGTTYLETFHHLGLYGPAGRCSGSTRRAVRPSKPLKTRQRYPSDVSARLSTRGLHRGNRADRLGRQPRPSTWSWTTRRFGYSFSRDRNTTVQGRTMTNPRTSLKRLSELCSLALGAAVGAILANPMATIHSWAELLNLLVFWR